MLQSFGRFDFFCFLCHSYNNLRVMLIANPIYDVVFKYMMEDLRVAKTFISAIIGEEVEDLDFCPQELVTRYRDDSMTVIRMDFLARIKTVDGHKAVIIEMQKALLSSDIKRFRRYLGSQYQSKGNIYTDDRKKEHARQIYCIFFLGKGLDVPDVPVLTVTNQVKDRATGKELVVRNEFIDSLHHRSWIVQISSLKRHRRDDLEKLLSIFDQNTITDSHHILNVNEDGFPEEFRHIIRRLKQAAESREVAEQMTAEDELICDFQSLERQVAEMGEVIEENKKALDERDRALDEKDRALDERDKALDEKDKALDERDRALDENRQTIEELKKQVAELRKMVK
jgi:hypothetical protein